MIHCVISGWFRAWRVLVVGMTIILMTALAGRIPASAQDGTPPATPTPDPPPAFVIQPPDDADGFLTIELGSGESGELTVLMGKMRGNDEAAALAYKADVVTLPNGGLGVLNADSVVTGPTTWVEFETERYTWAEGEGIERAFGVSVPEGTLPGEYVTALVIQNAEPVEIPGNAMFDQIVRRALPILITVPGPLEGAAELGDPVLTADGDELVMTVPITNTGNRIVNPSGAITLTDPTSGAVVLAAPVEMGSVYAGHETTIRVVIRDGLTPGDYAVDISLADEARDLQIVQSGLTVAAPDPDAPVVLPPVSIQETAIEAAPSADTIQFLNVSASIGNSGEPLANARLIFHVTRDGELVEDFPLASSLSLPSGSTDVQQRYIPITGWEPGLYAFALTLESVDPSNGVATVIERLELLETVAVS